MKTIGILGGMSAASTQLYYRRLCDATRAKLGGLHSPQLLIRSVDFAEVEALQLAGEWARAGELLQREAQALVRGGAQLLLLATNTMHKVAPQITDGLQVPFLHIGDATAREICEAGFARPGLLGTAYTMEQNFYTGRLRAHGLQPLVPEAAGRAEIHRIIFDELCKDVVTPQSRAAAVRLAEGLAARGADCLILGCTEVGMLLAADNAPLPVFDTALIHCDRSLQMALE